MDGAFFTATYYRQYYSADSQPRTTTVADAAAAAFYDSLICDIPICVDVVDKRHRTCDSALVASAGKPPPIAPDSPSRGRGRLVCPRFGYYNYQRAISYMRDINDHDQEDPTLPSPLVKAFAMFFSYFRPLDFLFLFARRTELDEKFLTINSLERIACPC